MNLNTLTPYFKVIADAQSRAQDGTCYVVRGLAPTANGVGLRVDVAAGDSVEAGTPHSAYAGGNVTCSAAPSGASLQYRRDIVYRSSTGTLTLGTGTAALLTATTPVPPPLPANSTLVAVVFIAPGQTTLASTDVEDCRQTRVSDTQAFNVKVFGATGDGTTDDTTSIQNAITAAVGGGDVYFPPGTYKVTSTLTPTSNVRLVGGGMAQRWRATVLPTRITYTGTTACIRVAPANHAVIEGFSILGLQIDGTGAGSTVDGVVFDASAGAADTAVEGVLLEQCSITNFGRYQLSMVSQIFDLTCRRVTMHNSARAADNLVNVAQGSQAISQVLFDDCFLLPYTAAKWAVQGSAQDVRFVGGTIAPYDASATGANGIWISGGLFVYGTHFEGPGTASTTSIGMRYEGANGAFLAPSFCSFFGVPVQIGQVASATGARGWVLSGNIGAANGAGKGVEITNGGLRNGTILSLGNSAGSPTLITDERATSDGVYEVINLLNDVLTTPKLLVNQDIRRSIQTLAYAASLAVNATAGEVVNIAALTGNITIGAPTNGASGQFLTFLLVQDGTGGRTVTWNGAYIHSWSDTGNTLNRRSSITFMTADGTNWVQIGAMRAWA